MDILASDWSLSSVIGTTGTGKSSTISLVTGQLGVRVSSSAESVTRQCEVSGEMTNQRVCISQSEASMSTIRGQY